MTPIRARIGVFDISAKVDSRAPLRWRFWTLAGFPGDQIAPRLYGGSRCLPRAVIDLDAGPRWLCAMELDHSLRLFCSHDLFPCRERGGAEAFARAILRRHVQQPNLL
jgi:hypothetical protein